MTVSIGVLQSFAIECRAPGRRAEKKTASLHITRRPSEVSYTLESEHRIKDVERNQRKTIRAVGSCGRYPSGKRTRFVDAFFKHLTILGLSIRCEFTRINRFVQLAF